MPTDAHSPGTSTSSRGERSPQAERGPTSTTQIVEELDLGPDGSLDASWVTELDDQGRPVRLVHTNEFDQVFTTVWTYDVMERIERIERSNDRGVFELERFTYDLEGRVTTHLIEYQAFEQLRTNTYVACSEAEE